MTVRNKIVAFILLTAMMVSLVSCGKPSAANSNSGVSSGQGKTDADTWNPEVSQRDTLLSKKSMCGVCYMYYSFDENENVKRDSAYYQKIFKSTGSLEKFPFLADIPDSQIVRTPMGNEIYLIIPADEKAHVEVYLLEMDEATFKSSRAEKPLYTSDNGAPIVLQCNYSDLFSDAEIVITDSTGQELKWSPFITLRDGRVYNKTDDEKEIFDFTEYDFSDEAMDD